MDSLAKPALLLLALAAVPARAELKDLPLSEALRLSEENSPALAASRHGEEAAAGSIGVARSGYLPVLEFDGMDSSRFPEEGRNAGIGGLIGSPYRSGRTAVGVARETLWDFGRTSSGLEAARRDAATAREETRLARLQVDEEALTLYFDCGLARSQREALEGVAKEMGLVAREVNRFVKTGQTSVVARYLVESQIEETETAMADYSARETGTLRRLALLTGLPEAAVLCPRLPEGESSPLRNEPGEISPLLARAESEAQAASARAEQASAGRYPRLLAAGTAGTLDAAGINGKGAYAFAAGLSWPLFDGLRTTSEIGRARALAAQKAKELEAARQRLAGINLRYDEAVAGARGRLAHLGRGLELAQQGFDVAKKRYLSLQGDVVDLREALRYLLRTRTQINDAEADLLKALGGQALVNGARPR